MDFLLLIIIVYLVCHTPAIIMLYKGMKRRKTNPESAKTLLIIAGIYFLIGGGVCGALLS
jgi:hypothetical protein